MSQNHLGLFDTTPDRIQHRAAAWLVAALCLAALAVVPVAEIKVGTLGAFVPVIDAVMFTCELMIATMLFAQVKVYRSRALSVLATGYVFTSLILVIHAVSFPGSFSMTGLLGANPSNAAWMALGRRAGLPIFILLYAILRRTEPAPQAGTDLRSARVSLWVLGAAVLVGVLVATVVLAGDRLPALFVGQSEPHHANFQMANVVTLSFTVAALITLGWRGKSVLDLWLQVSLAASTVQTLLNLYVETRFTIGWCFIFVMMFVSSLIVMLALVTESTRLYHGLALERAAREREREARLMSMDAVAAAICHEIGQPLTAITTNASAGLRSLDRKEPDIERAISALQATVESGKRGFEVIKSVRTMFSKGAGEAAHVDLNKLVRETAMLLDRELAGGGVSLDLRLDDALPPVLVDRVQIQQVLVNLLTNAIEAMTVTRGRPRKLAIRSAALDEREVLLEVSDTGKGIANADMPQIFDAFYTTKPTGTGLGLSLCRTIVEEHGGRLWASAGDQQGATFHVRLPRAA